MFDLGSYRSKENISISDSSYRSQPVCNQNNISSKHYKLFEKFFIFFAADGIFKMAEILPSIQWVKVMNAFLDHLGQKFCHPSLSSTCIIVAMY